MKKYNKTKLVAMILAMIMLLNNEGMVCIAKKTIHISKKSLSIYTGDKRKIKVLGTSKKINWISTNKKIAEVSGSGNVIGKKAGSCKIIATVAGRKNPRYSCKVTVGNHITGMKLQTANMVTLEAGKTSQIKATVIGKKALYSQFKYSSQNKDIVTVNSKGVLTGKSVGLTSVKVTSKATKKNGKKVSATVNVCVTQTVSVSAVPAPSGNSSVIVPSATVSPGSSQNPAESAIPGPSVPTPSPSNSSTLQDVVNQIPVPDNKTLVASTLVVSNGTSTNTLYFINRNFSGTMALSIYGHPLSSSRLVSDALHQIVATQYAGVIRDENKVKVLHLSDENGKCEVYRYENGVKTTDSVRFQVYETDSFYSSPYALIIAEGDTTSTIILK